jgi:alcohol dehydrogenase (cytochrome c)
MKQMLGLQCCIATISLLLISSAHANDEILRLSRDPAYWVSQGGNNANWHYSELDQINNKNIGKLTAAWSFSTGSLQGHAGNPLVIPASASRVGVDLLLLHTAHPENILAINLESLETVWAYESGPASGTADKSCCELLNYGVNYANGRVFLLQADNSLVAIDIRNGNPAWKVKTGDPWNIRLDANAPVTIKDYLITTHQGDGSPGQGWISAHTARDGRLVWKAENIGSDADMLLDADTTHMGNRLETDSGIPDNRSNPGLQSSGTTGGAPAWDPEMNLVYYIASVRHETVAADGKTDNNYFSTIYARDIDTGMARWMFRLTPTASWIYEDANAMILVDFEINGIPVAALVYISQSGVAYTIDRKSGVLLAAGKFEPAVNWTAGIDILSGKPVLQSMENDPSGPGPETEATSITCPALPGAINKQPSAYSPRTGLIYIPASHLCARSNTGMTTGPQQGITTTFIPAGTMLGDGSTHAGQLVAWDATQAEIAWTVPEDKPIWSGALATAGDVVFYGTLDGYAKAVDAKTGKLLWEFKTPSGIVGNFVTWRYKDKQYLGVVSGKGNRPDTLYASREIAGKTRTGGTLMVFSLP